jgi:hypothetical protein
LLAYLWEKEDGEGSGGAGSSSTSSGGGGDGPTTGQIKFLTNLGIPEAVAKRLKLGAVVEGKRDGNAGKVIDFLKEKRDQDTSRYRDDEDYRKLQIRKALTKFAPDLIKPESRVEDEDEDVEENGSDEYNDSDEVYE